MAGATHLALVTTYSEKFMRRYSIMGYSQTNFAFIKKTVNFEAEKWSGKDLWRL
jgi:hypothetical protein